MSAGRADRSGGDGAWAARTKVAVPAAVGLRRPRIEERFADLAGGGLWVVQGAAGAGKTTAVSQAVASCGLPTAWITCDKADDTAGLRRALAVAVGVEHPDGAVDPVQRLDRSGPDPVVVVYDDVHTVVDAVALEDLQRLVDLRPPSVALVLVGRFVPLDLTRARLGGAVVDVDGGDLRFRLWEVDDLFRSVHRQALGWQDLSALERSTGGWAAGLQLFHLATRGRGEHARHRLLHELGGRSRARRDYLTRQALALVEPKLRTFLVETSVFDELTGARCDRLLQRTGSVSLLDELVARGLFTDADPDGRTYRYHDVLRSHLREVDELESGPAARAARCRAAADILLDEGDRVGALRLLVQAGSWEAVGATLAAAGGGLPGGQGDWLDVLPEPVLADPWVRLAAARRLVRRGRVRDALAAYRQAEEGLRQAHGAQVCRRERALVEKFLDPDRSRPVEWVEIVRLADTGGRTAGTPALELARAVAHLLRGEAAAAATACDELLVSSAVPADVRTLCRVAWAISLALAGDPSAEDALDAAEEAVSADDVVPLVRIVLAARSLVAPGRTVADEPLVEACDGDGDEFGGVFVHLLLGLAHLRRGDDDGALLAAAEAAAQDLDLAVARTTAQALGLVVAARRGDDVVAAARRLVPEARQCGPLAHAAVLAALAHAGAERQASARLAREVGSLAGIGPLVDDLLPAGAGAVPESAPVGGRHVGVSVLGELAITVDGEPVDLGDLRPRHAEVLAYLATRAPGWVHRDELAEQVWPGSPADRVLHRVQTAVSAVRRLLEPGARRGEEAIVVRDGARYRLDVGDGDVDLRAVETDVVRAQRQASAGDVTAAAATVRAVLERTAGGVLPAAGALDWAAEPRRRLEVAVGDVVLHVAQRLDDDAARARLAESAVEVDRWNDDLWRTAISANERAGNAGAARRLRARYEAQLGSG